MKRISPRTPRKQKAMKVNPQQNHILDYLKELDSKLGEILIKFNPPIVEKSWLTFVVTNRDLRIYTTIIASNIHHACNKATKDLQGKFHSLYEKREGSIPTPIGDWRNPYQFKSIAEFNALIKQSEKLTP